MANDTKSRNFWGQININNFMKVPMEQQFGIYLENYLCIWAQVTFWHVHSFFGFLMFVCPVVLFLAKFTESAMNCSGFT